MLSLPLLAVLVQSLSGAAVDALQAPAGTKAIVFLFTSTDCPISNRYAPEVQRVVGEFSRKGVVFRLVYPNPADHAGAIREHMAAFSYEGALDGLRDPLKPGGTANHSTMFTARHEHRVVDCGHNLPWEAPHDFADAILTVRGWTAGV